MESIFDLVYTREELSLFAKQVIEHIESHKEKSNIFFLKGDLGAGKTSFVKEFGALLGFLGEIHSPTYTILQTYPIPHKIFKNIVHVDAYRVDDDYTWNVLHMEEYLLKKDNLVCIEWPDKFPQLHNYSHYEISIDHIDMNTRKARVLYYEK